MHKTSRIKEDENDFLNFQISGYMEGLKLKDFFKLENTENTMK